MSLCQNKKTSCGACCGIFNLNLNKKQIHDILLERTNDFKQNVVYSNKQTLINYRTSKEESESELPKKDPYIYNCPFLGFIDNEEKRIGCMIHPILTGDEKSQNYSFYGASICSVYDCKNKEERNWLELILSEMNLDYYEYSSIASNHIFISKIQKLFYFYKIEIDIKNLRHKEFFKTLFVLYLKKNINFFTSFELEMEVKEYPDFVNELLDCFEVENIEKVENEIKKFFEKK